MATVVPAERTKTATMVTVTAAAIRAMVHAKSFSPSVQNAKETMSVGLQVTVSVATAQNRTTDLVTIFRAELTKTATMVTVTAVASQRALANAKSLSRLVQHAKETISVWGQATVSVTTAHN